MNPAQFARAVGDIAAQVVASMQGLRVHLDPDEKIYVYALVVPDDFASVMGYANTTRHLAASAGRPWDKWYFAEWFAEGMELETEVLKEALGSADFHDDRQIQHRQQATWLLALAEGLRMARAAGALEWRGRPVAAFCSVIDSEDAGWVERETARLANPPELLATFEAELATATWVWFGMADGQPRPLQAAFQRMLQVRGG
jgi:hypothetical protein